MNKQKTISEFNNLKIIIVLLRAERLSLALFCWQHFHTQTHAKAHAITKYPKSHPGFTQELPKTNQSFFLWEQKANNEGTSREQNIANIKIRIFKPIEQRF